ncbi:MAG: hypothetical protein AAGC55_08310 [Myxococcota bacterium]
MFTRAYRTTIAGTALIASALLITACAGEETISSNQGELRDGVLIVDEAMMEGAAVSADSLSFPARNGQWLGGVRVGDVLVSGVDNGYLRRIVAVDDQGEQMVFTTEPAQLDEALASATLSETIYSDTNQEGFIAGRPGDFGIDIDLSGTELYAQNGLRVTLSEGTLVFKPTLDVDLDVGVFSGVDFELIASGELDARFVLEATAEQNLDESVQFRQTLFTSPTIRIPLQVGPLPLTLAVTSYVDGNFAITAGVSGRAEAGADLDSGVTAGFRYDGQFNLIGDSELSLEPVGPSYAVEGTLSARASLAPRLEVLILDSAGPTLGVEGYAQVAAAANAGSGGTPSADCELTVGLRGDIGGKLTIINMIDLAELDYELFDSKQAYDCLPL